LKFRVLSGTNSSFNKNYEEITHIKIRVHTTPSAELNLKAESSWGRERGISIQNVAIESRTILPV
jgi:hypothetical protein